MKRKLGEKQLDLSGAFGFKKKIDSSCFKKNNDQEIKEKVILECIKNNNGITLLKNSDKYKILENQYEHMSKDMVISELNVLKSIIYTDGYYYYDDKKNKIGDSWDLVLYFCEIKISTCKVETRKHTPKTIKNDINPTTELYR